MHHQSKFLIESLTTHPDEDAQDTFDEHELRASLGRSNRSKDNRFSMMDLQASLQNQGTNMQIKSKRRALGQINQSTVENRKEQSCRIEGSQYQKNDETIQILSQKLDQLYRHYRTKMASLQERKKRIKEVSQLREDNEKLSGEIGRIRKMVKDALLVREKSRFCEKLR